MKRIAFVLGFVLVGALPLQAKPSFSKVGTASAPWLKVPVSAREVGMGWIGVTQATGGASLFWNPGLAPRFSRPVLTVTFVDWLADVTYGYVGYIFPQKNAAFGISVYGLFMGEMNETTIDFPEGTGRTFAAGGNAVGFTYARQFTDRLSVGGTLKMVREFISQSSARTFVLDMGGVLDVGVKDLRIGFAMNNFFGTLKYEGRDLAMTISNPDWAAQYGSISNIPFVVQTTPTDVSNIVRFGASMTLFESDPYRLLGAVQLSHPNDGQDKYHVGFEFSYQNLFSARLGYRYDQDRTWDVPTWGSQRTTEGLTAGFGINYSLNPNESVSLDYGFLDNGAMGANHFLTLSYRF
ncbi:MAG: PorV/PorQ family protein [Candidatus Hydrothermae bacterium]|nr:PorV/PorQ family protein [Candidatus Hydrothermae bacterium]